MAMETASIYCRLSQDDGSVGESGSIQTQENICQGGFRHKKEILNKLGIVNIFDPNISVIRQNCNCF
jgi:hypothetical protein